VGATRGSSRNSHAISKRTGQVLHEQTGYAVTSLLPDQARPADLLRLWQTRRTIERVHWLRDAVFGEDRSTTHAGHPQVQAAFRNLAIAFIHHWRGHQVTAAREYDASHPAVPFRQLGISPSRR
jgi:hypothetical protein